MPIPRFWQLIEERYRSGLSNQFLLYFNVNDIIWDDIYGYLFTKDYLMERMNYLGCDAVIYYSRSEGLIFPNIGLRNAYQSALKLTRIEEIEPLPQPEEGKPPIVIKNINAELKNVGQERMIRDPQEAMLMIENFFRQGLGNIRVGLLINDVEKLIPNRRTQPIPDGKIIDVETLQRWSTDMNIKLRGHIILMLTENIANVAPELLLNDGYITFPVRVPIPTYQERLHFIRHLLYIPEAPGEEGKYKLDLPEGMLSEEFANITHGLTLFDIQHLWMTGKSRKTPVSPIMVVQQNKESIRKRSYGRLELIFGDYGLDSVGGLGNIIQYISNIVNSLKSWDVKAVPMGILMVGPPGTGKTNLIRALSRDMGIHFVQLKGLRGFEPETRNEWDLLRALEIIRSLTPVVAFIDDIDKIVYNSTDEYERRIMNQLLSYLINFMSDPTLRGRVLWVAASNRPDLIHPEFRKQGRLDDVIPFLLPDLSSRQDILRKIISRNAIPYDEKINFSTIASRTEGCTGGDLELIIMRSFQKARLENRDTVIEQDLIRSASEFIPANDSIMNEYLMLLAIKEASLSPLLPRQMYGNLQDKVYENNIVNKTKINQRLRELEPLLRVELRKGYDLSRNILNS